MFQPLYYTLKKLDNTEKIISWKSEDLLTDKLTTSTTTNDSLSPSIKRYRNSILFNQKSAVYTPPNRTYFSLFMNEIHDHKI